VPPRDGEYRLGCYMRCYTIFDDLGAGGDNDPYKWRRGGPDIELDLVSVPTGFRRRLRAKRPNRNPGS